ncbi:MAG: hypothetical protein IIA14_00535 [SAR324 cluster bacterium]|nr:hypothetical protein [SAR324 cluster bacterium]
MSVVISDVAFRTQPKVADHFIGPMLPVFGTVVVGVFPQSPTPSESIDKIIEDEFQNLSNQWRLGRNPLSSSVTEICAHPAYQAIIALGWTVIPHILRELESEVDHWFWALEAITGEKPVSSDAAGDLDQMTQAWVDWGRSLGLVLKI